METVAMIVGLVVAGLVGWGAIRLVRLAGAAARGDQERPAQLADSAGDDSPLAAWQVVGSLIFVAYMIKFLLTGEASFVP